MYQSNAPEQNKTHLSVVKIYTLLLVWAGVLLVFFSFISVYFDIVFLLTLLASRVAPCKCFTIYIGYIGTETDGEITHISGNSTTDILKVSVTCILWGPSSCATLLKVAQQ